MTVGNDGAGAGAGASDADPPGWWEDRVGFHSASRATTGERRRAHRRRESSGESVVVTMWISNGFGLGFGFGSSIVLGVVPPFTVAVGGNRRMRVEGMCNM